MREQSIQFECADGFPLRGTLFNGTTPAAGAVIIAPAMGVPQRFYTGFARYLAERGFLTLTFDYRGIGGSTRGPVRGARIRMEDWGRLDIDAALRWTMQQHRPAKTFLLGHSAGGQLAGLAQTVGQLDGLVFTAVSSAYWGHWRGGARLGMLALMYGMVPAMSTGRDFYPAKKGGLSTVPIPAGVTSQWARWARKPGYLYDPANRLDLDHYRGLSRPLLAFQFDDDNYAPQSAHDAILAAYPKARIQRRPVRAADHGGKVGHFGFFRDQHRDTLWRETADWLHATG